MEDEEFLIFSLLFVVKSASGLVKTRVRHCVEVRYNKLPDLVQLSKRVDVFDVLWRFLQIDMEGMVRGLWTFFENANLTANRNCEFMVMELKSNN